jgi:hypothetical protein
MQNVFVFEDELKDLKEMFNFKLMATDKMNDLKQELLDNSLLKVINQQLDGLPISKIDDGLLNKKVESWSVLDDDPTGNYDERLIVKLEGHDKAVSFDFKNASHFSVKDHFTEVGKLGVKGIVEITGEFLEQLDVGVKLLSEKKIGENELAVIKDTKKNLDYTFELTRIEDLLINKDYSLAKTKLDSLQTELFKDMRDTHKKYQDALNGNFTTEKTNNNKEVKFEEKVEKVSIGVQIGTETYGLKDFKTKNTDLKKLVHESKQSIVDIAQKLLTNLLSTQSSPFKLNVHEKVNSVSLSRDNQLER